MISNKFDGALYINLARREDRKIQTELEFSNNGVIAERIEAIDGNPNNLPNAISKGHVGCVLSHIKCLEMAKANGWKSVLIFEDDVEFKKFADVLFNEWWKEVPDNWDMLFLGGNHFGHRSELKKNPQIVKYSDHLYRTYYTITTHAIAVKHTMYDYMLERLRKLKKEIDREYAEAQEYFNVYTFKPNLAWQRTDFSDITNKECDYSWMKNN